MKKYVKQIIIAVIVATVASCALYFYDMKNDPLHGKPKKETVTDAEGHTYLVVEENDGNARVAVTGEDGKVYMAEFDGQRVGDTVKDKDGNAVTVSSVMPENLPVDTTAPLYSIDDKNDNQYTGVVSEASTQSTTAATTQAEELTTQKEETTTQKEEPTTEKPQDVAETTAPVTQSPPAQTELLAEKYKRVFEGGTYKMEFTTNDEELSEFPVTAAFKNGNILMRTTLMGIDLTIIYYPKENDGYLVIHKYKKYCKLPETLLADMQDTAATGAIDDGTYISVDVKNVEIDGEKLVCEEYSMEDGATIKYYFKDGSLVRRDRIEADGLETDMYITMFTSDVPDSDFEIPDNYSNINISWLSFLLDQ
ncbi:MAG: hypothetical protein MJ177_06515 [Clostridia bacterium]|nr:hypothetical protein [Clostridia bacterium]